MYTLDCPPFSTVTVTVLEPSCHVIAEPFDTGASFAMIDTAAFESLACALIVFVAFVVVAV